MPAKSVNATNLSKSQIIGTLINQTRNQVTDMSQAKIEAERLRKQMASIAKHYRAIGPAAITAALLHSRKPPLTKSKVA